MSHKKGKKFKHDKVTKETYRSVVGVQDSEDTDELILTDSATVTWDTSQLGKAIANSSGGGGGSGITQLTGDVTAGPGSGSQVATITPYKLLDGVKHQDTTSSTVTAGDIIYGNNTPEWDDLPIGASGQVLTVVSGLPAWGPSDGGPAGQITLDRKIIYDIPAFSATTFVGVGGTAIAATGTPSTTGAEDSAVKSITLGAVAGNVVGWSLNAGTGPILKHRPLLQVKLKVIDGAGDDSKYRLWIMLGTGIGAAGGSNDTAICSATGGADNINFYGLCYERGQQANWMLCSGDGLDWDCTDTGVAATASNNWINAVLDARDAASLTGSVNGVSLGTHTLNLPGAGDGTVINRGFRITASGANSGTTAIRLAGDILSFN